MQHATAQDPVQQALGELMNVLNADDILAEVNSFKALTSTNLYMLFELEDDSTYFPYVFNLYYSVRVERVEPYIIFKAHLTPIGDSYLTKEYKVTFTIEPSPGLQDKADQLNAIAQQINDLLKNGFRLADVAHFKNTIKDAIKQIGETLGAAMDALAELPGIIKEVVEEIITESGEKVQTLKLNLNRLSIDFKNEENEKTTKERNKIPQQEGTGEVGSTIVLGQDSLVMNENQEQEFLSHNDNMKVVNLYKSLIWIMFQIEKNYSLLVVAKQYIDEPEKINELFNTIKSDWKDKLPDIIEALANGEEEQVKEDLKVYLMEKFYEVGRQ